MPTEGTTCSAQDRLGELLEGNSLAAGRALRLACLDRALRNACTSTPANDLVAEAQTFLAFVSGSDDAEIISAAQELPGNLTR